MSKHLLPSRQVNLPSQGSTAGGGSLVPSVSEVKNTAYNMLGNAATRADFHLDSLIWNRIGPSKSNFSISTSIQCGLNLQIRGTWTWVIVNKIWVYMQDFFNSLSVTSCHFRGESRILQQKGWGGNCFSRTKARK